MSSQVGRRVIQNKSSSFFDSIVKRFKKKPDFHEIERRRAGINIEPNDDRKKKSIVGKLVHGFLGGVGQKRPITMEQIAAAHPVKPLFTRLSESPNQQIRQLANDVKKYSSCPVSLDAGDILPSDQWDKLEEIPGGTVRHERAPKSRERPNFECPDCGWPTHASKSYWEMDRSRHGISCDILRQWTQDEHDWRSGRPLWELNFAGRQPRNSVLNFTDWNFLMVTRKFPKPVLRNPVTQRHISKLLTYPYTLASVLYNPWVYYDQLEEVYPEDEEIEDPTIDTHNSSDINQVTDTKKRVARSVVTDQGWHLLSSLSHGINVAGNSARRQFDDFSSQSINFTTEPTAPHILDDVFRIFILGAATECRLPPSVWEQLCSTFPGVPFRLYFIGPDACLPSMPLLTNSDPILQFRSVLPSSSSRTFEEVESLTSGAEPSEDKPAQKIKIHKVPLSVNMRIEVSQTLHHNIHEHLGPFRQNRDIFVMFNSGIGHPVSRESWKPTIEKVLKTRCLVLSTSFNATDQKSDLRALEENFEGKYQMVLRPCKNKFSSMRPDIPADCAHDIHQWAWSNGWIFAIQGIGTDVGSRKGDTEATAVEGNSFWGKWI